MNSLSLVKSVVRHTTQSVLQHSVFTRPRGDSFNMMDVAYFNAAVESAQFYEEFMLTAQSFGSDLELLAHALQSAPRDGLIMEFGVASGRTIRHLAELTPRPIHGFDSFEGLPETWRTGFQQGKFKQALPSVPAHVRLHAGWFSETLPGFLAANPGPVALLHVDCDLYSSTRLVLEALRDRLPPGAVIVFDEYFNYPGWKRHEHQAWQEFIAATGRTFEFDSFVPSHQQVCVRLT
jgi:methyltransferase family protein